MGIRGKRRGLHAGEDGQASLMIGMMMMTFILFFAFVVNTGMLVNAKINLQNAADLAAYAGAATEARQLTLISYLNYEMRRQYKKFLFRYYVLGNMAQAGFPRTSGQSNTPYKWSPDGSVIYGVPAVCIIFDSQAGSNDNFCQLAQLPPISIPSNNAALNAFDMINATLTQQLQAIEQIRQDNCGAIGNANVSVLMLWLFNTDPTFKRLPAIGGSNPDLPHIIQTTEAIASGVGLVPREIILHERINTIADYVNMPPLTGVTHDKITALESGQDPASNERTIQAFLSAYYTLGEHTFDPSQIEMDELLPSAPNGLLNLKPIQQSIQAYAVRYTDPSGNEIVASGNPTACQPRLQPVTVNNVPLGVTKDPTILTYYAVRLKATAKVMFSPFGDMQLKAYAAARPFGSRIGPTEEWTQNQFGYPPPNIPFPIGLPPAATMGTSNAVIPNLAISSSSGADAAGGWNSKGLLHSLYSQMSGVSAGSSVAQSQFQLGIQAAMAPNPIEGGFYNIINDLGDDPMVKNFDTYDEATFWAPVVSPAKQSNLQDVLQQDLTQLFQGTTANGAGNQAAAQSGLQTALTQDILQYAQQLEQGQGEITSANCPNGGSCPGESMNLVRLQDPIPLDSNKSPIQIAGFTLTDPSQIKTSYVNTLDNDIATQGRVGYSVKFVSFDSLLSPLPADGMSGIPTNTKAVQADAEAGQDVQNIKH